MWPKQRKTLVGDTRPNAQTSFYTLWRLDTFVKFDGVPDAKPFSHEVHGLAGHDIMDVLDLGYEES